MSEQPQLPLSHTDSEKDVACKPAQQSQKGVLSGSSFQDYIDLESECSGIFSNLDIETAKQFISKMQP